MMQFQFCTFLIFFIASYSNTISILRVAYLARRNSQIIPISNGTFRLLTALKSIGYLEAVHKITNKTEHLRTFKKATLRRHMHIVHAEVTFKYIDLKPRFSKITIISKKNHRIFVTVKNLSQILKRNPGTQLILSNSRGIMSHQDALNINQGGLLLCSLAN